MLLLVAVVVVVIDEWLADSVFAWLPETIVTMATVEGGEQAMSTGALVTFLVLFFITNGVVGPITEELYFRGHLLPRIDRYGRGAPVLNTVLFTRYHFHTPMAVARHSSSATCRSASPAGASAACGSGWARTCW